MLAESTSSSAPLDVTANDDEGGHPTRRGRRQRSALSWSTLRDLKGASFTFPFLVGFALFTIVPILMGLAETFYTTKSAGGLGLGGEDVVTFTGFEQIGKAFVDQTFWAGMGRVFAFACVIIPLTQIVALLMALLLDAARRRWASRFRVMLLVPYMVPGMVATLTWLYLYSPVVGPITPVFEFFGIPVDFYSSEMIWISMGNLLLWNAAGFNMLILYGSLQAVPGEIFDAARVDGAGDARIAWSIKVPFVRSSLVLTSLLSIIGTLQLFAEPTLFRAVRPETITRDFTPSMYILDQAFMVGNINYATALSIVLAIVVGVFSAIIYRLANRSTE